MIFTLLHTFLGRTIVFPSIFLTFRLYKILSLLLNIEVFHVLPTRFDKIIFTFLLFILVVLAKISKYHVQTKNIKQIFMPTLSFFPCLINNQFIKIAQSHTFSLIIIAITLETKIQQIIIIIIPRSTSICKMIKFIAYLYVTLQVTPKDS